MTEILRAGVRLNAVMVGDATDGLVQDAARILGRCEVESTLCESVYECVGLLGRMRGGIDLVAGRLSRLGVEGGRFFEIASKAGAICCCLADVDPVRARRRILGALEAGAFLIEAAGELEGILAGLPERGIERRGEPKRGGDYREKMEQVLTALIGDSAVAGGGRHGGSAGFAGEKFRTTQEELDALLGAQ